MSFADSYLQKHAIRGELISEVPAEDLHCIVTIPAYNESGLTKCLDSLFKCHTPTYETEVIILINIPENADSSCVSANTAVFLETGKWIATHTKEKLSWHLLFEKELPRKHFGAGLARKISMDEAIRRFNQVDNPDGILLSLDADTTVESNYLTAICEHYKNNPGINGCSINFEHHLDGNEFDKDVYKAIINYELHQRYYLNSLRFTGYPFAYHTVGSAFSVKAGTYVSQGGMSKRQAGEDFYFIQKVAMLGAYSECRSTCVHPSPRPSLRVPFGTGPDIFRQLHEGVPVYKTYDFSLFRALRTFFTHSDELFHKNYLPEFISLQQEILKNYLSESGFIDDLSEIRENSSTPSSFKQRFVRKFNLFWILKFLHYAEENAFEKTDIMFAVKEFSEISGREIQTKSPKAALISYRHLENSVI